MGQRVKLAGMETVYYSVMTSPVGPLTICCSEKGLLKVNIGKLAPQADSNGSRRARFRWVESQQKTRGAEQQLAEYFAGRRRKFTVPLDLRGTPFQRSVWAELQRIPYGETRSYADIARQIRRPRAFRAVGMANHWNPVAIVVPCHRVLATGGGLGGYGGGLRMKEFLLALERGASTPR